MEDTDPLRGRYSNATLKDAGRMKKPQPAQAVLLGFLIVGLVAFLFASGYGIGRNIAAREQAAGAGAR